MFVLKKEYDKLESIYQSLYKAFEDYKEQESKELVLWAIQMKDKDELFLVWATDITQDELYTTDRIICWQGNKKVAEFSNVKFYVLYDAFNVKRNMLDS